MINHAIGLAAFGIATALTVSSAVCASPGTTAFCDNIANGAAFIIQASELAAEKATDAAVIDFAKRQIVEQKQVLKQIRAAQGISGPYAVALDSRENLPIGRSSAMAILGYEAPAGTGALLPVSKVSAAYLVTLRGQGFDQAYRAAVSDALGRLSTIYDAYSKTGDNSELRVMAFAENGLSAAGASWLASSATASISLK